MPRLPRGEVFFDGAFLAGTAFFTGSASSTAAGFSTSSALLAVTSGFDSPLFFFYRFIFSCFFFSGALLTMLFFLFSLLSFLLPTNAFSSDTPALLATCLLSAGEGSGPLSTVSSTVFCFTGADCLAAVEESRPPPDGGAGGGEPDGGDVAGGGDGGSPPPNLPSIAPTAIFNMIKMERSIRIIQPTRPMMPL